MIINKNKYSQYIIRLKNDVTWTSLAVQWLRHCSYTAGAQVQPLVGELRSHMLHSVAKKQCKSFPTVMPSISFYSCRSL